MHIDTFSGHAFWIAEVATFIGKMRKKRIIMTLRGGRLPEFFQSNPQRTKKVLHRATYLQTPSMYLKDFFANHGIQLDYLPNSIDLTAFPYSREKIKTHSILWVRAFTEIYNPELAIKTFYEVRKIFHDATLTLVGPDKGLLMKTKKLISYMGLDSFVIITGPVPNDQLYKYYHSHEVFLNTTSYESFGVAVLEAAACGIPIVSSKVGELPYLWEHEKDILFVEKMEPNKFAEQIAKLFTSKQLAVTLSKNARLKAENFAWEKIKDKWIKLLSA